MKRLLLLLLLLLSSCTKDFGQYALIDRIISQPDSLRTIMQTDKIRFYPEMDSLYLHREGAVDYSAKLFKGFNGKYIDKTPFLNKISTSELKRDTKNIEIHEVTIASENGIYQCCFAFFKENKKWYLHSIKNIIQPGQYYDVHYDTTKTN